MTRTLAALAIALAALGSAPVALAQPHEDGPGWDCRTMGNMICGPGNGVQAGQYDTAGKLTAWPHEVVPAWCKDICLGA